MIIMGFNFKIPDGRSLLDKKHNFAIKPNIKSNYLLYFKKSNLLSKMYMKSGIYSTTSFNQTDGGRAVSDSTFFW